MNFHKQKAALLRLPGNPKQRSILVGSTVQREILALTDVQENQKCKHPGWSSQRNELKPALSSRKQGIGVTDDLSYLLGQVIKLLQSGLEVLNDP